jgi:TRAP-type uncharacterized transport system substrate-binding protein
MKRKSKPPILDRSSSSVKEFSRQNINRLELMITDPFGRGTGLTLSTVIFTGVVIVIAALLFIKSAPPKTIIMSGGDKGSLFQKNAEKYAAILARNGVKLKILDSKGSQENLNRLTDPKFKVDVAFVQTGIVAGRKSEKLVSLGSVSYEPLYLFYRADKPFHLLSQFSGRKLSIGPKGTGAHNLALALLAFNGIEPGGKTALLELDDESSEKALLEGKIDGVFLMTDSASTQVLRELFRKPEIKVFNFSQADAYIRRLRYLNKLVLPKGINDFGKNIPDQDITLLSPTVDLIARDDLHPALSDLLLEAATEVHSRSGRYQRQGEFPAPQEHDFPISADAQRYYKSGKSFFYRYLPFWLASLLNRLVVVVVPMILVLIPGLKSIPAIFNWRIRMRILRWYRALLFLEGELTATIPPEKLTELLGSINHIEEEVNKMKIPASFGDQFYSLRSHIAIVRNRLMNANAEIADTGK